MGSDMKRVGLVFDADGVVDFRQSLKNVNSSLSENRAQFKLTKSTWDDTTKASQKLKDTQTYLSKQYEESAKKVNVLSTELKELEDSENRDEAAISKKKAALSTATASMNNYKKGLDEVSVKLKAGTADIEAYAKKLDATGKKISATGKTLTKGLTAPIAAAGTAAMAAWYEIDEAYDNIVAGTGATGDNLQGLQDVFDEVFGSMPVEAMDASNAIADLNTRFGFTGDTLRDASEEFLKFSEVNKTDVSQSIQLVSRAMGDAGIESSQYSSVMDALTAASQASGLSIESLTTNLAKYGAPMRALGYDTQESIAIFAQWEKAGVNTEIAFSGMKKSISNWGKEGKDARVEFKKTLKEIEACPDIASATSKAIEVFGAKAGPDLADAIQSGRFSIEEMMKVVEKSGGIVEQSYNDMLNPADKAKVAMNNLKLAGAELGDTIQTALGPILQGLSDILKSVTSWFKNLDDKTKMIIVTVGALIAAIGPLLVIIGTVASSISKIILLYTQFTTASAGTTAATGALGTSFSTLLLPITAVIAIIAAVVAAVTQLWNTNDQFRASVEAAMASVQETLSNLWETILKPIFDIIVETLNNIWENGIKPLWDEWVAFVGDIIIAMTGLWDSVKPIVMWFIDTFGPQIVNAFHYVGDTIANVINTILGIFESWVKNTKEIITSIIGVFKGIIDFIKSVFTGDWEGAWNAVVSIFENIFDGIVGIVKVPINLVIGLINGMIGALESGINYCIRAINTLSFDVPDWVPFAGGEHWGFDFSTVSLGRITPLAKGGTLMNGMALVAEAGPELLLQQGTKTTVMPLSNGGGATPTEIVDYDKMAASFIKALRYLQIKVDDDVLGKFVDERMLKVI